ncbi:MAG: 3-keto-disaccharide hydrolase [Cyclobacteriaceae bacterium]
MRSLLISAFCLLVAYIVQAQDAGSNDFAPIFDGETLNGWTATEENPESFSVKDGTLICKGGKAHLFYTGEVGGADFKNFELKLKVQTTVGSNSGVYFQTAYQKEGWPSTGFEAQVNSTHTDPRKTGSLYGIANIWAPVEVEEAFVAKVEENQEVFIMQPKAPSTDGEWFDYHIVVIDKTIEIMVNGVTMIKWTQPELWPRDRKIGHGTVALQAHDPKSETHYKDIKIKILE